MTTPVTTLDRRYSDPQATAAKRFAAAFTTKWDGRWQWEVRDGCFYHPGGGPALMFSVTPAKIFAHAKGDPFGATTHKF